MKSNKIRMYFSAIKEIKGNGYIAEKWLDNNSHKLSGNINNLSDAKKEILGIISK